jgi:flavin reductase (DIM6/NTAB) family NADH-FMN oxidoreductase RutF
MEGEFCDIFFCVIITELKLTKNSRCEPIALFLPYILFTMFKKLFQPVDVEKLNDNFFRLINTDWMLITAGVMDHLNTMTASWGTIGILWNKPVAICFIRPHRYTFEFAEKYDHFTLSFFDDRYKEILNYCGSRTGKKFDKVAVTGLLPIETPNGSITFEQSRLVLECKKLYADFLKEENFFMPGLITRNYPKRDFHKFYVGEIVGSWEKP